MAVEGLNESTVDHRDSVDFIARLKGSRSIVLFLKRDPSGLLVSCETSNHYRATGRRVGTRTPLTSASTTVISVGW